jgi:hypothetical protein
MSDHVESIPLYRKRGDDYPMEFTIYDDADPKAPINITGFAFRMVVDPSDCPADASNNVLDLTGVLSDAPNGVFQFNPSVAQMEFTPDTYYYEIQMTDGAGNLRSIVKSKFIMEQDLVK